MPRYPLQKGVLILKENSPQFIGKLHLETHGTAMNTKTTVFLCQDFHRIH